MSLSDVLFTKLLALDAYFKGYSNGPSGFTTGFPTGQIGNATLLIDYATDAAVAEGFYAAAYSFANGPTVISYRGTAPFWPEIAITDVPIAAGNWQDDSIVLAMRFYNNVATAANGAPILLTGHSLGGGLAGFVASLTDRPAMLVDHIGFMTARAKRARRMSRAAHRPRPRDNRRA